MKDGGDDVTVARQFGQSSVTSLQLAHQSRGHLAHAALKVRHHPLQLSFGWNSNIILCYATTPFASVELWLE